MEFEGPGNLIGGEAIAPMLGLVARSVADDLDVLPLTAIRALVLLSHGDSMSVRQIAAGVSVRPRAMLTLIDGLETGGWLYPVVRARGLAERVSISAQGRELVERMTARRQREIDAILKRMSDSHREQVARAFTSFAAAAGESALDRPRKGIAP